ncbi:MAG: alginate export family protein, partial [Candidatus Aureabacteria bacterium]|nr:alginate export family protein [Candidatus Auribacterota bacterium]
FDNIIDCNDDGEDQYNFFRFRLRAFGEFAPTPEFRLYARITGEPRYYIDPDMDDEFNRDEFVFDNLYVEFKGGTDVLSTTRIGRQDIIQGSKLLILDGTPLDGSRTIYVDAIRQMFKLENMNIDLFLSQVKSEDPLPKINDQDMLLTEEDEQVHGILIDGKVAEDVKLEGYYYFHKTDDTEKKSNTLGGRIISQMTEEVSLSGELAYQFGEVGDIDIHNAMAGEVVLTYKPMDMQMTPEFKFSYTYLPGEDPTTEDTEAWDSLYGRWPRFSELYIYTYIQETRVALVNNIQRYTVSCGFVPMENLSAFAAINYLRANENPLQGQRIFGDGEERGWLYVLKAIYKFNDALTGHLWLEYLNPGDYYAEANQDSGYFFRYELMYTF